LVNSLAGQTSFWPIRREKRQKNKLGDSVTDPISGFPSMPHSNCAVNRVAKREIPQLLGTASAHQASSLDLVIAALGPGNFWFRWGYGYPEFQGKFPRTINGQVSMAEQCKSRVSVSVCLSSTVTETFALSPNNKTPKRVCLFV